MARAFTTSRSGALVARFAGSELELLEVLVAQLLTLVRPQTSAPAPGAEWAAELGLADVGAAAEEMPDAPVDPALARLFPDAHRDDPLAAADYRRLMEPSLRRQKAQSAQRVLDLVHHWRSTKGKQQFSREDGRALMMCLTDLRLVMAQRLRIESDEDTEHLQTRLAQAGPDDPEVWLAEVYEFLGWVQESLMAQLFKGIDPAGDGRRTPPPGTGPARTGEDG